MAFSGQPPPQKFNMSRYCLAPNDERPADKTALIVVNDLDTLEAAETWSFGELEDVVLRIAAGLKARGLERGDRLLIRLGNTSDYALLFYGAIAGGFVPIPASSTLSGREVAFFCEDCAVKAIALDESLPADDLPVSIQVLKTDEIAALKQYPERADYADSNAEDPAFIVFTSGTGSDPKGVLHAHRSAWGRRPMYQDWYEISSADRMLHAGAFNWTYTLGVGLSDPWANAASSVIYIGPKDTCVWPRLIAKHDVTLFAGVPTLFRQILKYCEFDRESMSSLRHGLVGGERLPTGLKKEWRARTGRPLYEAIGMSELSTYVSMAPSVPPKDDAIGKPQAGRHIEILPLEGGTDPLPRNELGMIACHRTDPGLMLGYWNRPDEEKLVYRGDWFLTGDLATMDDEGYVSHHGRADDLMNALGYRVSPAEVEKVLGSHPDVAEVAVAEIQVRPDVSVIGAFLVPKEGAAPNAEAIKSYAEERLAGYKVPREYVFLENLPRSPNGKVRRAELRASGLAAAAN